MKPDIAVSFPPLFKSAAVRARSRGGVKNYFSVKNYVEWCEDNIEDGEIGEYKNHYDLAVNRLLLEQSRYSSNG
jgi:hypothetical protein